MTDKDKSKCSTLILIDYLGKQIGQCKQQNLQDADVDHICTGTALLSELPTQITSGQFDVTEYRAILLQLGATDLRNVEMRTDTFISNYKKVIEALRTKNRTCCVVVSNMWGGEKPDDDEMVRVYNMALKNMVIGMDTTKNFILENEKTMRIYRKEVQVYEEDGSFTESAMTRLKQRYITRLADWRKVIARPKLDTAIDFSHEIKDIIEKRSLVVYPVKLQHLDTARSVIRSVYDTCVSSSVLLSSKPGASIQGLLYMRFASIAKRNSAKEILEKVKGEMKIVDAVTQTVFTSLRDADKDTNFRQFQLSHTVLKEWIECYSPDKIDNLAVCGVIRALNWTSTHPELTEDDLRQEFPTAVDVYLPQNEDGSPKSQAYLQFENFATSSRCKRHFIFKGEKIYVTLIQQHSSQNKKKEVATMTGADLVGEASKVAPPPDAVKKEPKVEPPKPKKLTFDLTELFLPPKGVMDSSMKSRVKGTMNRCNQLLINGKEKTAEEHNEIMKALKHCEEIVSQDEQRRKSMESTQTQPWNNAQGRRGGGASRGAGGANRGGAGANRGGVGANRGTGGASRGVAGGRGFNRGEGSFRGGSSHGTSGFSSQTSPRGRGSSQYGKGSARGLGGGYQKPEIGYGSQVQGTPLKRQAPLGRGRGASSGPMSKVARHSSEQYDEGYDYNESSYGSSGRSDKLIGTLEGLVNTLGSLFGNRSGTANPKPKQPEPIPQARSLGRESITDSLMSMSGTKAGGASYDSTDFTASSLASATSTNYSTDVDYTDNSNYTSFMSPSGTYDSTYSSAESMYPPVKTSTTEAEYYYDTYN